MALGAHMYPYSYIYYAPHRDRVLHQSLAAVPLAVWNTPSDNAKLPPGKSTEPTRRKTKPKNAENKDSLLFDAKLAAGAVSSILKDSDIVRSKEMPVDEVLASTFQGFALVSL